MRNARCRRIRTVHAALVCLPAVALFAVASHASAQQESPESAETKAALHEPPPKQWLDRLPSEDRALLDELIGYAPPAQTDALKWIDGEPKSWDELRGNVVVIQSWTSRSAAGRTVPDRLQEAISEIDSDDVTLLALHTPEGADTAERYLENRAAPMPVIVDPVGKFCDELGMYRRPVNMILDRTGNVRYAGLRFAAIGPAVQKLLDESWDESARPVERPKPEYAGPAEFPSFSGSVSHANDIRGQRAPEFHVAQWVTDQPNATDKVVVLDFWATWCPPCVGMIPHTNELADAFPDDVVCIGVSSETANKFKQGMNRLTSSKNITLQTFRYPLALDPQRTMQRAVNITGIPHMLVISSDWIVRWQGHPSRLTEETLGQIVAANRKLAGAGGPERYRWTNSK